MISIRKYLLKGLILILVIIFAWYSVMFIRNREYADFTAFKTSEQVELYIISILPLHNATEAEVQYFLGNEGIRKCIQVNPVLFTSSESINMIIFDKELLCEVLAPGENISDTNSFEAFLNNILIQWRYVLTFRFNNNILVEVTVIKADRAF